MTDRSFDTTGRRMVSYGRLAGWLLIGGALFTLPSALLVDPPPDAVGYAAVIAALAVGVACQLVAWERLGTEALHVLIVFAEIAIALTAIGFDWYASHFFLLLAVYIGFALPSRRDVIPQLVLTSLAIVGLAAYDTAAVDERLRMALFEIPIVWLCAGMVLYLRERVDERERSYERLAGETVRIAERIQQAGERVAERRGP